MIISVLIITRGRTTYLINTLNNLVDKTDDLKKIEIIVGFDPCDQNSLEEFEKYKQNNFTDINIRSYIFDERHGYDKMEEYHNEMGRIAGGEWLLFLPDRGLLHTHGWDTIIRKKYKDKFYVIRSNDLLMDIWLPIYPIIPKKWVELLNRVSGPVMDLWVGVVSYELGILVTEPKILFSHLSVGIKGTDHHGSTNYKFWNSRHIWEKDIQILREYIASINQDPLIYPGPKPY